jgi:molybdopterin/thiamine biosynthesis adenylyltransferase
VDHTRHIGIFDASSLNVSLIGAGGIGAFTALGLVKMGIRQLDIYDDDEVDDVNLATQLHRISDLGTSKVTALAQVLADYSDVPVSIHPERVTLDTRFYADVVISAVDSIQARKDIWEAAYWSSPSHYLDARMAAEEFQLYSVDMFKTYWYRDMLFQQDDSLVPDLPCTSKATVYCGMIAAGEICAAVRKIATGVTVPRIFIHDIKASSMMKVE